MRADSVGAGALRKTSHSPLAITHRAKSMKLEAVIGISFRKISALMVPTLVSRVAIGFAIVIAENDTTKEAEFLRTTDLLRGDIEN